MKLSSQDSDIEARRAADLAIVYRLATYYSERCDVLDYAEFCSVGYEAMVGAERRYDPARGARAPFLGRRVRGAMIDAMRQRRLRLERTVAFEMAEEPRDMELSCPLEVLRLRDAVATLTPVEQEVVSARSAGAGYRDIEREGLSRSSARRVYRRAVAKLRLRLRVAEEDAA